MSHHSDSHGTMVVRNACNACHTRKIRCETPQGGGPCLSCQAKDLSCYYLPRYKSGRPRVRAPLSDEAANNNRAKSPAAEKTASRGVCGSNISLDWSPSIGFPGEPELAPSPSPPGPQHHLQWHQQKAPHEQQHLSLHYGFWDPDQPSSLPALFSESLLDTDLMLPVFSETVFTGDERRLSTNILTQKQSDDHPSALTTTALRQLSGHQPDRTCDARFLNLLQFCSQLQQLIIVSSSGASSAPDNNPMRTPEEDKDPSSHFGEILECIDASCNLMLSMCDKSILASSGPGLDLASISLITAVASKILQACDISLTHQGLGEPSISSMLLQKKLDLNITQVRVVVAYLERANQSEPVSFKELSERCGHLSQHLAGLHQRANSFMDITVDLSMLES